MTRDAPATARGRPGPARASNLALALLAFTITFWAWNIIAPLGVRYTEALGLSASQKSLLVAMPVLVGSLGRIVTGALTDRFGGRLMFTVLTAASAVPVLLVALAGVLGSYPLLLLFGLLLGIAGTTFAIGIPFVNGWYESPARFRHRAVRRRHGRHRPVGVLHPAIRPLVRVRPDARDHRRRAGRGRGHRLVRHAQRTGLEAQHRPGGPQAGGGPQAAGDLADGVPVRGASAASSRSRPICRPTSRTSTTST